MAANLRALRPPDPYKQKGIRITGERLKKKAGKAGAKTARLTRQEKENNRGSTGSKIIARGAPAADSRAHAQEDCRHARASAAVRAPLSKHIRAQVIDDLTGRTIVSASSLDKEVRPRSRAAATLRRQKWSGKMIAERARAKGVEKVVFDRGGYQYHGRVQALADAAREAGLKF